jgi:pantetheine-phosphate adenylyltransferase
MEKIAVFPGSFDPFTKGHEDVVHRAESLFDKIVIAIGTNTTKKYMFTEQERIGMIKQTFGKNEKIIITNYNELTINFCKKHNANYILRGLRSTTDFEYEKSIAMMNKKLGPDIETILIFTSPELEGISSTIVREIKKYNGDISPFLPDRVKI